MSQLKSLFFQSYFVPLTTQSPHALVLDSDSFGHSYFAERLAVTAEMVVVVVMMMVMVVVMVMMVIIAMVTI